jgi:membrane protease YdiL (CAAX protease family)
VGDGNATRLEARRGSVSGNGRRSALPALAAWSAWCALPGLLARCFEPALAALLAFAALGVALLATREGSVRGMACAPRQLAALAAATCAGALSQPAWLRAALRIGLLLGLAPHLPPPAPPGPAEAPALWLGAALVGPAAEELLYRERLMGALRGAGPVVAVALSSALFALPHLEPWAVLAAFLAGLWLGALAWTLRGVALCVGYHVGLDAACLAAGVEIRARAACVAAALAGGASLCAGLRAVRAPRAAFAGALGLTALLAAASAAASVLEFEGELALESLVPALPPVRVTGIGVATLNGSGGGPALETLTLAGGITGTATVPITDPLVSNSGMVGLRLAARAGKGRLYPFQPPASLSTPQLSRGELPVPGMVRLCFLAGCSFGLNLPLMWKTANATVGLGIGGVLAVDPYGTLRRSVLGAPWTLRTASLTVPVSGSRFTAFASGFAHGPFSFTGSTALPGGAVQLVTPLRVESLGGPDVPSGFARLTLHFVPEPHSLFVLAPSIALLAAGAWRRRRRGGSS